MFKKKENEHFKVLSFVKAKESKERSGDALGAFIKNQNLHFVLCDGVSSCSSDFESSHQAVANLLELLTKKRTIKTLRESVVAYLNDLNKDLLEKNLSTTFCLFSGGRERNILISSGDSGLLARDANKNRIFYNNVYNLKNSSEGIFSDPDGREHMITTCLGHNPFRYEVACDLHLEPGSEVISFSDGILQYAQTLDEAFDLILRLEEEPEAQFLMEPNFDDLSLMYFKVK